MENSEKLKQIVKEKYSEIATQSKEGNMISCCGSGGCSTETYNIMTDDYGQVQGYNPEADLGLGCGIPTEHADLEEGNIVIDLGSGAGNDCFVARSIVGEKGKVYGVDMTPAMIERARINVEKLGYTNVEFRLGDIEDLPFSNNKADVVISNCVLNLVPDKRKAFSEIFRVLKPGGHFCISDVVISGHLPESLKDAAEMYVGCVGGAIDKMEYLDIIQETGFFHVSIKKEKPIQIPEDILSTYLNEAELKSFRESGTGIFSVTVFGKKEDKCCGTNCCN